MADKEMARAAKSWWRMAALGLAVEAAFLVALMACARLAQPCGAIFSGLLVARVVFGCVGAWRWVTCSPEPDFLSYRAKWVMQFFPGSMLSWSRHRSARRLISKLAQGIDGRIELASEQCAYYLKGSWKTELGGARREMACWASALSECKGRLEGQREEERMMSPDARGRALEELGLGKGEIEKSLLSLERVELSSVALVSEAAPKRPRRL